MFWRRMNGNTNNKNIFHSQSFIFSVPFRPLETDATNVENFQLIACCHFQILLLPIGNKCSDPKELTFTFMYNLRGWQLSGFVKKIVIFRTFIYKDLTKTIIYKIPIISTIKTVIIILKRNLTRTGQSCI